MGNYFHTCLSAGEGNAFATVANGLAARLRVWMALPAVRDRIETAEPSSR